MFFILQQLCLLEINTYLYKLKQLLYFSILSVFVNSRKQISSSRLDVWGFFVPSTKTFLDFFFFQLLVSSKEVILSAWILVYIQRQKLLSSAEANVKQKSIYVVAWHASVGNTFNKKACHLPCLGSLVSWENKSHGKCKWET